MRFFSLPLRVQTSSEAQLDPHPMGTGGSYPGDKATEAWN